MNWNIFAVCARYINQLIEQHQAKQAARKQRAADELLMRGVMADSYVDCLHALCNGANPNIKVEGGNTLFHKALENGQISLIPHFLENGAQANAVNDLNETPLEVALKSGGFFIESTLCTLLKATDVAHLNKRFSDGQTLFSCCDRYSTDWEKLLPTLREKKLDWNLTDAAGHTPLYHIVQPYFSFSAGKNSDEGWRNIQGIVEDGARLTKDEQVQILKKVLDSSYVKDVVINLNKFISNNMIDPVYTNDDGDTALHLAARWLDCLHTLAPEGQELITILAQANGVDKPNKNGQSALIDVVALGQKLCTYWGCECCGPHEILIDRSNAVCALLTAGANPMAVDSTGCNVLDYAIQTNQKDVIRVLKENVPYLMPLVEKNPEIALSAKPLVKAGDRPEVKEVTSQSSDRQHTAG